MSKNLTRKGLALATALSFGLTGLSALPASAAAGDVTIAPNTGTGYTVFATDSFTLKTSIGGGVAATNLAYRISNPDQEILKINVGDLVADGDIVAIGYSSTGAEVAVTDISVDVSVDASSSAEFDFETLGITDLVLSSIDTAAATGNTLNVQVLEATSNDVLEYGDGGASVKVQAWVETQASADYSTVDAAFASAQETVSFIDPSTVSVVAKVERVVGTGLEFGSGDNTLALATSMNSSGDDFLTGSLQFSTAVNLDQVDLAKWKYAVDSSLDSDDVATAAIDLRASGEAWGTNHNFELLTPAGYTATNKAAFGKLLFRGEVTGDNIAVGETYKVSFRHLSDTAPFNDFNSAAFEIVDNTAGATANNITGLVTSSVDAAQTSVTDTGIDARAGVSALTYKTQVRTSADASLAAANVPVAAIVTAGTYFPTGESITVTGTTDKISKASGAVITTGLTNADGNWSVTVSSTTAKASQSYVVEFYVLDSDGIWQNTRTAADAASDYTTTYATAAPTTFAADSSVLSGASATVGFTVKDQFGQAISTTAGGTALNVELKAPDKTKLEKFAPVTAGAASFTFTNYLAAGLSDVITAKVYTGTSTTPTYVSGMSVSVSLYNTNAVAAVNVASEVTGVVVTYDDFITGASSSTNVAPDDNSFTYTGTVVDANGAGVPGAPVTISGKGFQFAKTGTTTYYVDSITIAASEAGTFSVTGYTHVASATGNVITATSGAKSGSTKIKSAIPATLSTKNLAFSWAAPVNPVSNTTYAVTATAADKWGNPLVGATVVFSGYAAAQFNGAATATKTTDKNGKATAYLRTLKDVDGLAAIGAELTATAQNAYTANEGLAAVYTDVTTTKWDESTWSSTVEKTLNFFAKKPTASITKAATSKVVVKNASGATIKVVRGSKSVTKVATSNSYSVSLKGGTGTVKVYVNGALVASKK